MKSREALEVLRDLYKVSTSEMVRRVGVNRVVAMRANKEPEQGVLNKAIQGFVGKQITELEGILRELKESGKDSISKEKEET